jgi:hypothetical protein
MLSACGARERETCEEDANVTREGRVIVGFDRKRRGLINRFLICKALPCRQLAVRKSRPLQPALNL